MLSSLTSLFFSVLVFVIICCSLGNFWLMWEHGLYLRRMKEPSTSLYSIDEESKMATKSGWPPIRVYVYPQDDYHTTECLYPNENPSQYVNETGFWFQRMLEPTVHHQFLYSPIQVDNPHRADVFLIPHYSRMCSGMRGQKRWNDIESYVAKTGDFFKRYSGVDHFIMHSVPHYGDKPADNIVTAEKGPIIGLLDMKLSRLRRNPWAAARSMIVPFITLKSQDSKNVVRNTTAFVAMSTSSKGLNGKSARLRQGIEEQMRAIPNSHVFVIDRWDVATFNTAVTSLANWMSHSELCIVPPGDAPSSKRFYDAISHLCIPYLLADGFFLPYEDIYVDYAKIIKQLPAADLSTLSEEVMSITADEKARLRDNLMETRKRFTWDYRNKPQTGEALWTLSWAIYDKLQMLKPYTNNEMTGWDLDPNFTINV